MFRTVCICLSLAAFAFVLALMAHGQQVGEKPPIDPKVKPDPKTGTVDVGGKRIPLDKFKLPPNAILVLCDNVKDAVQLYPSMFLLTPEKYLELTERIAALDKLLKPERKLPHTCKLNATVKGDVLDLRADLYFDTDQPRQIVFLGFRGSLVNQALLKTVDEQGPGQIAALDSSTDGYVLQADKPGKYHLELRLELPILNGTVRGQRPKLYPWATRRRRQQIGCSICRRGSRKSVGTRTSRRNPEFRDP